jgi:hypothetical protein
VRRRIDGFPAGEGAVDRAAVAPVMDICSPSGLAQALSGISVGFALKSKTMFYLLLARNDAQARGSPKPATPS